MAKPDNEVAVQDDKGGYRQINKALNICVFEDYLDSQRERLPVLADVEQLTPRVLRVLGQNPGKFTYQGTNTYIVGTGKRRLMIDTGGGELAWAELIESSLKSMGIALSHVLLTHWHGDHTGGVPDLLRLYPYLKDEIYKNDPNGTQQDIMDNQIFAVEGATVRAIHVPGHSEDHMCFILEEEMAMFTGDNILGHGTSVVEDLGTFMASMHRMAGEACNIGYSAHGVTITDLPAKISTELDSRYRRERQVLNALKRLHSHGQKSASVGDVVMQIYGTVVTKETRELALEPFINEVLCKLAGDLKIAFQIRGATKKWYSIESVKSHSQLHTLGTSGPRLMDVYAG